MSEQPRPEPWWVGLTCTCLPRLQPWSPWHRPDCEIARRIVQAREQPQTLALAVGDLAGVGFASRSDGAAVVLDPAVATAIAREVRRLRERLTAAEAPPY